MNQSLCSFEKYYCAMQFRLQHLRRSNVSLPFLSSKQLIRGITTRVTNGRYETIVKFNYMSRNVCSWSCRSRLGVRYQKSFLPLRRKFCDKADVENFNKTRASEFKRLFNLAKPEKWKIAGALCLLFVSSGITIAVPFSLGKVIDIIQTDDPEEMKKNLRRVSTILLGLFCVGGLANFGRVYLISVAGQAMTKNLRDKVFRSLLSQELAFFDKKRTGELVNRLSSDTLLVCQALTKNISDGLRSALLVVGGVSFMFYMSPELAFVGLSVVPPVAALAIVYGRFVKKLTRQVQDSLAEATSVAEEKISNIRTVQAFSHEKMEIANYESKLGSVLKLQYKEALARALFFGMTGLSGNAITLTVLCYGGGLVSENTMSVGNLTSFLMYAAYIGLSIGGLSSFYSELNRSLGASTRLWEIIDRVPQIQSSGSQNAVTICVGSGQLISTRACVLGGLIPSHDPRGTISFRDVTFSYPTRKDTPVLMSLSLDIPEATVTAIVGPSGSGKSTIASILLRLYDPDAGKITLDGVSIDELSPNWIRKQIGYVSQEPILFSGSIRENILYGVDDASAVTDEQLIQATKEANCYDFITKNFSQGFETKVGERGVLLSGGQKQRIAIARALIKNPKILLLDEATSALDAESEHLVQESLEIIMKERTVLVIAHRLSSIKNSDQIIVLDRGRVVEKGTYHDLMMNDEGNFKKLVKHQAFF
ncbi:hypothetical protein RUM43_001696 [Polyplax serrata]|uniref:ATP-binding cassette sub-family B member 10, mitochondrial n=1 Tax=Polyplax serrata TaxID=468196 RepID=A0AAN8SF58_POLSC